MGDLKTPKFLSEIKWPLVTGVHIKKLPGRFPGGLPYVTALTILTVNTTRICQKLIRYLMTMFIIKTPGFFWTSIDLFSHSFFYFISRLLQQCEAFAKTLPELDPERLSSFYRHANPSVWYISLKATGDARYFFPPCLPVGTYLNLKGPRNKMAKFRANFLWIFHLMDKEVLILLVQYYKASCFSEQNSIWSSWKILIRKVKKHP